jgi:hypothetical protein
MMWSDEMLKITTQSILLRSLFSIGSCMAFLALTAMPSRTEAKPIRLPFPEIATARSNLPAELVTLRNATGLQGGAIGFAGQPSTLYQAFEKALQAGKKYRPGIEQILREGRPGGRIYAAMLLANLDPKAGRQALEQMRSDKTALKEVSGCIIFETTVGAVVDDILKGRSGIFSLLPPAEELKTPALRKAMSYPQARQLIINAGWQPLVTTTDNPKDGTKSWRDSGYNEVVTCSGTGMGFCRFEFTGSGNQKLVVVTGGSKSTLQKWWKEPKNASQ